MRSSTLFLAVAGILSLAQAQEPEYPALGTLDSGEPCEDMEPTTTIPVTVTEIVAIETAPPQAQNAGQGGANAPNAQHGGNHNDADEGRGRQNSENGNGGGRGNGNQGNNELEDEVQFSFVTITQSLLTPQTLTQVVTVTEQAAPQQQQIVTVTEQAPPPPQQVVTVTEAAAPVAPVTVTEAAAPVEPVTITESICTTETGLPPPGEAPAAPPAETVEEIIATSTNAALEPTPIPSGMGEGVGIINEAGACDCQCLCGAPAFFTFIPEPSATDVAPPSTFETVVLSGTSTAASTIISSEEIVLDTSTEAVATSTEEVVTTEAPAQETGDFFFVSEILTEPVVGSTIPGLDSEILLDTSSADAPAETTTTAEVTTTEVATTTTEAPVEAPAEETPPTEGDGFFFVSSLIPEPVVSVIPKVSPGNFFEVDNGAAAPSAPPASNNGSPAQPENVQEAPVTTSAPQVPIESAVNGLPEDFDINTYSLSNSYVLGNLGSR